MAPKNTQPSRKRQAAKFSLSPLMKPAEDLLRQRHNTPSSVDMRTIGVSSLSHASAAAIVDSKDCPYTICGWPKGQHTNERYNALLSLKDEYDIYFFLCKTSPDLCVVDLMKFKFSCLDHHLRRVMCSEISDGKASASDFLGVPPLPFATASEVEYITYLKWIEGSACLDKDNHRLIIYRAECLLLHVLESKGFKMPEGICFSESLRSEARQYDADERPKRNVAAHIFTHLLMQVKDDVFKSYASDFPPPRKEVIDNMKEVGKKVLILEHLKSKVEKVGDSSTQMVASLLLIEAFLGEKVKRCQEVSYGDSRVMVPGMLRANTSIIKL